MRGASPPSFLTSPMGSKEKETPKIIFYSATDCSPCKQLADMIKEGKVEADANVELVDIETDEGFSRFEKEILSRGEGAVPSAYFKGEECAIQIVDDEILKIQCPKPQVADSLPS